MPPRPLAVKVLDIAMFAPLSLAVEVGAELSAGLARSHRELRQRVQVARWVGEMAVTQGRNALERRLAAPVVEQPHELLAPFEGYDQLTAAQVVQLLRQLPQAELALVGAYEAAHRQRRTILAKIDQLAGV